MLPLAPKTVYIRGQWDLKSPSVEVIAHSRRQHAEKRGGGELRGESVFVSADDASRGGIQEVLGKSPSPALAAEFAETLDEVLDQLEDEQLKTIVVSKLDGYTHREIADQLDCSERNVAPKLKRIRERWSQ